MVFNRSGIDVLITNIDPFVAEVDPSVSDTLTLADGVVFLNLIVYYESIKRELNKRLIVDSRCDARLKGKDEGCTHLSYTMCHEEP